jgi:hypothetical protein
MHARGVPGGGRAGGVGKAGGPGLRRWCVCLHPTTRPSLAFELGFPGAISLCPARSRLCVRSETLLGDSVELIRAGCHGAGVAPERGRPRGAGLPHHEADVPRSAGTGHRSWHATPLRGRRCVGEAPEGDGRAVLLEAPEVRCLHSVLLRAWSEVTELHCPFILSWDSSVLSVLVRPLSGGGSRSWDTERLIDNILMCFLAGVCTAVEKWTQTCGTTRAQLLGMVRSGWPRSSKGLRASLPISGGRRVAGDPRRPQMPAPPTPRRTR